MVSVYRASYVTLHVRKSNRAAFKLYQDALAFRVVETEKSYCGCPHCGICSVALVVER